MQKTGNSKERSIVSGFDSFGFDCPCASFAFSAAAWSAGFVFADASNWLTIGRALDESVAASPTISAAAALVAACAFLSPASAFEMTF